MTQPLSNGTSFTTTKISYIVGAQETLALPGHCFGVNTVCCCKEDSGEFLFSGGRDGTIRQWHCKDSSSTQVNSYIEHFDWINDLVYLQNDKKLISCSSDCSIKIWDSTTSKCIKTLNKHVDYVKVLGYSANSSPRMLASAGLDSMVIIWDVLTTTPLFQITASGSIHHTKGSIYSMALAENGHLLLTGSTEKVIRAFDTRSGNKKFKLKGHTDNIKCLVLNKDATQCLSGSSDGTIRLWDLRQQRCVHTFNIHEDSVWTLAVDDAFSTLLSGGKDKHIFKTNLSTLQSDKLCTEDRAVLKVIFSSNQRSFWSTTTDAKIHRWGLESAQKEVVLPGHKGIVKHHVLNNKRHVLTKDSAGSIVLWDITQGVKLEDYGAIPLEEKTKDLLETINIPNWFSVDTKGGSLVVTLEYPHCFAADVYTVDCGLIDKVKEDIRVNLGECLLRGIFSVDKLKSEKTEEEEEEEEENSETQSKDSTTTADSENKDAEQQPKPNYTLPSDTPIIISDINGVLYNNTLSHLSSLPPSELSDVVPHWVVDALIHNKFPSFKDSTMSFHLEPDKAAEKPLPPLPHGKSKLSAHRTLRIHRVANYVLTKLNIKLEEDEYIEILCNSQVLSANIYLSTARHFFWKSAEELVLKYRLATKPK